jgi:hypothetical protein
MDNMASPSIVEHDSLRDTLGIAQPLHASVYNIQGNTLSSDRIRYGSPDSGVTVDTLSGYVVADSVQARGIRLFATAGKLQSAPDTIFIVPAPDTVFAINPSDTIAYSLLDTAAVLSNPLQIQLLHRDGSGATSPVRAYIVSYNIVYPTDTVLAQLMARDGVRPSTVDTTDGTGISARRIRLRTLSLTSATDSVIVDAMVRYRGSPVTGAPIRFVVQVKPQT